MGKSYVKMGISKSVVHDTRSSPSMAVVSVPVTIDDVDAVEVVVADNGNAPTFAVLSQALIIEVEAKPISV